jgi:hypothetical protein
MTSAHVLLVQRLMFVRVARRNLLCSMTGGPEVSSARLA